MNSTSREVFSLRRHDIVIPTDTTIPSPKQVLVGLLTPFRLYVDQEHVRFRRRSHAAQQYIPKDLYGLSPRLNAVTTGV